jgi:hypothetical protein
MTVKDEQCSLTEILLTKILVLMAILVMTFLWKIMTLCKCLLTCLAALLT